MDISEFVIGSLLGEGKFGRTYKARRKNEKKKIVLKRIETTCQINKKAVSQEIAIQGLIEDNSHLVKLLGHFVDKSGIVCLLMEYCKERDLELLIKRAGMRKTNIEDEFICKAIKELCLALLYLEEREILHHNVKPSSVYLTSEFTVKLGDFRHAHYFLTPALVPADVSAYSPPEVVLCQPVTFKGDVWSVGCVAYALHQLRPPFCGLGEELRKNICGRSIQIATTRDNCQPLFDFIGPMMATNCFFRPTFKEILQHPLMQQVSNHVRPFKPVEELAKGPVRVGSSGTDSSEGLRTTVKLDPNTVRRPSNFPAPPRKVRFVKEKSADEFKWYEIEPKQNVAAGRSCLKAGSSKEFSENSERGSYTKEDLEKAVAEKLAIRKFTMKYLRKTGKENYIVQHTKL
ncbi:serine/threonine-protein kinase Nek6-like [Cloeon dipterum]|uniref:serine/threonine-protein kinase Nek6-like n=1 Tax=Cloeon dipterum TaxID=197152 RepID=UPI0032208A8F